MCGCADAESWSLSFMRCQCGVQRGRSTVALGRAGSEVNALWMCTQASVHIRSWEKAIQGEPVWSNPQIFLEQVPTAHTLSSNNMFASCVDSMQMFRPRWKHFSSNLRALCSFIKLFTAAAKKAAFVDVIEGTDTSPELSQVFFLPPWLPSGPPCYCPHPNTCT